jgi:hypothetical protein
MSGWFIGILKGFQILTSLNGSGKRILCLNLSRMQGSDGSLTLFRVLFLSASEVVLQALDIIFAKIITGLHLNEGHILGARIHDTVCSPVRNIDRFTGPEAQLFIIPSHNGFSVQDEPMFRSMPMPLQT